MWKIPQTSRANCYRPDMPRNSKRNDTVHMYIHMYVLYAIINICVLYIIRVLLGLLRFACFADRSLGIVVVCFAELWRLRPEVLFMHLSIFQTNIETRTTRKVNTCWGKKKVSKSVSYQELYCSMTCTESSLIWEICIKLSWRIVLGVSHICILPFSDVI